MQHFPGQQQIAKCHLLLFHGNFFRLHFYFFFTPSLKMTLNPLPKNHLKKRRPKSPKARFFFHEGVVNTSEPFITFETNLSLGKLIQSSEVKLLKMDTDEDAIFELKQFFLWQIRAILLAQNVKRCMFYDNEMGLPGFQGLD